MRFDLRLQQTKARIERLALEFTALELEGERLIAREGITLSNERRHRNPGREQHAAEQQQKVAAGLVRVLGDFRIAAGSDPVRGERSKRHHGHHRDQLHDPAGRPRRQPGRPLLHDAECQHRDQPDDDSAGDDDINGYQVGQAQQQAERCGDADCREHAVPSQQQGEAARSDERARGGHGAIIFQRGPASRAGKSISRP